MITIDANQYNAVLAGATVLEESVKYGPSVWRTDDNRIIKAFHRRRRGIARHFSYARRFARHCRRLAARGVRAPTVDVVYRCPEIGSELVIYRLIPGTTVRTLTPGSNEANRVLDALPGFLASLHGAGIHFRGIHLGNVLHDAQAGFALIDVSYMRFLPWPLTLGERASNFRNILGYERDAALIEAFGLGDFMQRYIDAASLSPRRARRLARLVRDACPESAESDERVPMTTPDNSYVDTRERFNDEAVARDYVTKKNRLDTSKNRREMACITAALDGVAAGSRVLDLPCGTGRLARMLLGRGYRVVAADYSLPMIEAARAYHRETGLDADARARLDFVQQDVMNTTFEDDAFDVVICNRLLHHYPGSDTRRAVLAELARICRGRLIVSYYDRFALSALKFHLRNRLRNITPTDRIPIAAETFRRDYEHCGLRLVRTLPVRRGVSPQTYLVLASD